MDSNTSDILHWLQQTITAYPLAAGLIIFTTAFLESLLVVGVIVPGAILMIIFGALIALDMLNGWTTLAYAVTGAIAGDGLSFWIGRRYRDQLRSMWPLSTHPVLLERGADFFTRHGGKSILFGRFVGPVRAVIPTIAGMMDMHPGRFALINILSALAWAPLYLLPGLVFGASLELASEIALRLVGLIFGLTILLLLVRSLVRWVYAIFQPHTEQLIQRIMTWSHHHPLLGKLGFSLVDPHYPESPALVIFALLLPVVLIALTLLSWAISGTAGHGEIDLTLYRTLQSLRTPLADDIMATLTLLGSNLFLAIVTLITAAWLVQKHYWSALRHWLGAIALVTVLVYGLKIILAAPRPELIQHALSTFSFPSAHTAMATTVYGLLAVMINRDLLIPLRRKIYVLTALLITSIAFTRLYLGAHWFSDVLAGLLLGLGVMALFGIAYRRHTAEPAPTRSLMIMLGILLPLVFTVLVIQFLPQERQRYQARIVTHLIDQDKWWQSDWRKLAAYRNNLAAAPLYPMNIQWQGEQARIREQLRQAGWHAHNHTDTRGFLQWLNVDAPITELPLLPHVHNNSHETIRMVQATRIPNRLNVIRLWPAIFQPTGNTVQLWVGSVTQVETRLLVNMITYPATTHDFDTALQSLIDDLSPENIKTISRDGDLAKGISGWSGQVLLVRP